MLFNSRLGVACSRADLLVGGRFGGRSRPRAQALGGGVMDCDDQLGSFGWSCFGALFGLAHDRFWLLV